MGREKVISMWMVCVCEREEKAGETTKETDKDKIVKIKPKPLGTCSSMLDP